MILAALSSSPRRLAAVGLVAWLAAGCAVPTNPPTPSPTAIPTLEPTAPAYSLGPTPTGCPTSTPAPMAAGSTATVTFTTNYGTIVIKVTADMGPNAAGAFVALARCGYYDNVLFHRIAPGFVIQGGDGTNARLPDLNPDKMGQGGPSWTILDDKVSAKYVRGMVAMANTGAGSADASLTGAKEPYAQFGMVTSGMDVVDKIALVPTGGDSQDQALLPVVITGTTVTTP
jgi:cyclophilin family peptidyl-prolyl cis-trans isomerase